MNINSQASQGPEVNVNFPQAGTISTAQEAHQRYMEQQASLREAQEAERRELSGLYGRQAPAAVEETPATKEYRLTQEIQEAFSESPALFADSTEAFCKSLCQNQTDASRQEIRKRQQQLLQATADNQQRQQAVKPLLLKTPNNASATTELKAAMTAQARALTEQLHALPCGESLTIAGTYGEQRSVTQGLLELGTLFLGKNVQALPPVLKEAFKQGTPDADEVMHGLFSIINAKRNEWQEDPAAKRIIDLFSQEDVVEREELIRQLTEWVADWQPNELRLGAKSAAFIAFYHLNIPSALNTRDHLLKALIPTENNALHSAMESLLPPTLAARFANPADAPKTMEEIIKLFLEHVCEHVDNQLSQDKETDVTAAIDRLVQTWKDSKGVQLATFLSGSAFSVDKLVQHWAVLKEKKQESPLAFAAELGRIALEMNGAIQTDPYHQLHLLIDENVESLIKGMLTMLPPHLRTLSQDALLSPMGEYIIKCKRVEGNIFDIEVYASGPVLKEEPFQGKWPIHFKHINQEKLTPEFFQALLQSSLASKETSPFSSSPKQFKEILITALDAPSEDPALTTHVLSNNRLSAAEMAHYYLNHDHQEVGLGQHPAVKRLLWQCARLKSIAREHVQNGRLIIDNTERAKAMESAISQLRYTAQGMQQQYPKILEEFPRINALCQEIEFACEATWKRHSQETLARDANTPTPVQVPDFIKAQVRPYFVRLKKSVDKAERIFSYIPFATSWAKAGRKAILKKVFNVNGQEAERLYAVANKEFYTPEVQAAEAAARSGHIAKAFTLIRKVTDQVGRVLGMIYDALNTCLSFLLTLVPEEVAQVIGPPAKWLGRWLAAVTQVIQERLVSLMIAPIVRHYLDEDLMKDLSTFGRHYTRTMASHPELSFEPSVRMDDGEYAATDFTLQLSPLNGFASLDKIRVTVADGTIMGLQFPDMEGAFTLQADGAYVHALHGKLCLQQFDPKLSAFRPYLLVEDENGKKEVLLREVLASDQLTDFLSEKQLGAFLWNGAKSLVPQSQQEGKLYTCKLTATHLTSYDPKAMLYIMRSYLIRNDNEAAYYIYREFEQLLQDSPRSMPDDLAAHLLPLALGMSETASKIRLSLFTMLEQQRLGNPEESAWKNHPLYGMLWMLLCADLHKAHNAQNMLWLLLCGVDAQPAAEVMEDPRFPNMLDQTPLLRTSMLERMKEHLPFYTSEEMGEILKQVLHVEGSVSPQNIQFLREYVRPFIDKGGVNLLPQSAQAPEQAPVGLLNRGLQAISAPIMRRIVREVPNLIAQAPYIMPYIMGYSALSEQEQSTLSAFFAKDEALEAQVHPVPYLSIESLKVNFWSYYRVLHANCMSYAGIGDDEAIRQTEALKMPILLLSQDVAHDEEAAGLVKILQLFLAFDQDPQQRHLHLLERFRPAKLQKVLREEGPDALASHFKALFAVPTQIESDSALLRCSSVAQIAIDARDVASYVTRTVPLLRSQAKHLGQAVLHNSVAAAKSTVSVAGSVVSGVLNFPANLIVNMPQEQEGLIIINLDDEPQEASARDLELPFVEYLDDEDVVPQDVEGQDVEDQEVEDQDAEDEEAPHSRCQQVNQALKNKVSAAGSTAVSVAGSVVRGFSNLYFGEDAPEINQALKNAALASGSLLMAALRTDSRQEAPQERDGPYVEDLNDGDVAQEPALPFVSFEDID